MNTKTFEDPRDSCQRLLKIFKDPLARKVPATIVQTIAMHFNQFWMKSSSNRWRT